MHSEDPSLWSTWAISPGPEECPRRAEAPLLFSGTSLLSGALPCGLCCVGPRLSAPSPQLREVGSSSWPRLHRGRGAVFRCQLGRCGDPRTCFPHLRGQRPMLSTHFTCCFSRLRWERKSGSSCPILAESNSHHANYLSYIILSATQQEGRSYHKPHFTFGVL